MTASILTRHCSFIDDNEQIETYIEIDMKTLHKFKINKFICNYLNIFDLFDEIFFSVFEKFNTIDVFCVPKK